MNLYSLRKIRSSFLKLSKEPKVRKNIAKFLSDMNIFGTIGIKEFYLSPSSPDIFVSEDTLSKLSLLGNVKFDKHFSAKKVSKANLDILIKPERTLVKSLGHFNSVIRDRMKKNEDVNLIKPFIQKKKILQEKLINELPSDLLSKKIVSLDFEFFHSKDMITEFGLSIKNSDVINSQHYLIEKYHEKKSNLTLQKNFKFGETKTVSIDEMRAIITDSLKDADYIVFHDHKSDCELLNTYSIGLENFPNLKIIDTQLLHKSLNNIKSQQGSTLLQLLEETDLTISKRGLHNSGNDAHYTLQLLLEFNKKEKVSKPLMHP